MVYLHLLQLLIIINLRIKIKIDDCYSIMNKLSYNNDYGISRAVNESHKIKISLKIVASFDRTLV